MITPAGKECTHYYEDFNRGRSIQECRLIASNPHSPVWKTNDCQRCPVPEILWANASEHLELTATIKYNFLGMSRRVHVDSYCRKHEKPIKDPHIGCLHCAAERPNIVDLLSGSE